MHQPLKSTSVPIRAPRVPHAHHPTRYSARCLVRALVGLALLTPGVFGNAASAAAQSDVEALLNTLRDAPVGLAPRLDKTPGGAVRFVAAPPGGHFVTPGSSKGSTGDAEGRARAFL